MVCLGVIWLLSCDDSPPIIVPTDVDESAVSTDLPADSSGDFSGPIAAGSPISFELEEVLNDERVQFSPAVGDLNGDGRIEFLGAMSVEASSPRIESADQGFLGAGDLEKFWRDNRLADLNGDGILDLVANTYCGLDQLDCFARLYLGNGDGTFQEVEEFHDLQIRGFGETILAADFDNDGDLDLFIPHYSHNSPDEHSFLLINDGNARFADISEEAGVAIRNQIADFKVEGAQALDFDGDGWLDFYVASRLFRNNGDLTFTDIRADVGLPERFDEGIRFIDWNNDGKLDFLIHTPIEGPSLYEFDGALFHLRDGVWPADLNWAQAYGLNTADLDNDGLEDVVIGSGVGGPKVFRNTGLDFELIEKGTFERDWVYASIAFGDLNSNGRLDAVLRTRLPGRGGYLAYYSNQSSGETAGFFVLEILGPDGQQNQAGRVVRIFPESNPDFIFTRIVDGGSGFLSQNQYKIQVGTPFFENHIALVQFSDRVVSLEIRPGETKQVFADGRVILR